MSGRAASLAANQAAELDGGASRFALELRNVSFRYEGAGETGGIREVGLAVRPGECVVLTGPSGSGKTTCTRVANGLAPAFWPGELAGSVLVGGSDAIRMPLWERGRAVGSVFQDPASQFFSSELAGEVAFCCENYGLPQAEIVERTDRAIASFRLDDLRSRPLDVLSSGEKQRVAVASACAPGPGVVVCDEPTANLDEEGSRMLAGELARLKAEGRAVLVSEHRLAWLGGVADRVVYLADGRVLWDRPFQEVAAMGEAERARLGLRSAEPAALPDLLEPAGSGDPVLAASRLCHRFGGRALWEDVSFRVWPGQVVALTGCNGSGKSTLARALAGLIRPRSGSVSLGGSPLRCGARRKRVWYGANDTTTQFFTTSVSDELLLGRTDDAALVERARSLLVRLGLYPWKDVHPATLSGGQKQRLALACGLLSEREVLVFDEPTSGLDGGTMALVADAVSEAASAGKAVVVVTHDGELARRCCTHRYRLGDAPPPYPRPVRR